MLRPLIFLFFLMIGPLQGAYIPLEKLLEKAKLEKLDLPKAQKDGRIQSLNKRGAAIPVANKFIDVFIKY